MVTELTQNHMAIPLPSMQLVSLYKEERASQAWWHLSIIPVPGRWRHEDQEFKVTFSYMVSMRLAWAP